MKILKQFGVIFGVCWISLVIEHYLPFSFPASVIGMVLLLICLLTGFLKIEHVQEKADFLLSNMAFFFVPAGVSIINYFDELKSTAVQLIIICIISTVVTFAVMKRLGISEGRGGRFNRKLTTGGVIFSTKSFELQSL